MMIDESTQTANDARPDFLSGRPAIFHEQCARCMHVWYLPRSTCARCGSGEVLRLRASGAGVVHACTLVHRAPTAEFKGIAPYLLVFVDAVEGFRLMAHGDADLQIGDQVRVRFDNLAGRLLPLFSR